MRIALFNHKGGVSKTTTTFNLGWMLASKANTVVMVDTDPQCNLTGMALGYEGPTDLEHFYEEHPTRNIRAALSPAFEARPVPIAPVECFQVDQTRVPRLYLLPGHIRFAEYEVTMGIAQELSSTIQTLQNVPGSIAHLLEQTETHYRADYTLIDMSPSLGSINQNLLMTSQFFLIPISPDFFSVMAIDSLATTLPKWMAWARKAATMPVFRDASYPFPAPNLRFLGTVIQKFRPRGGEPAEGFQRWIDRINNAIAQRLIPVLRDNGMLLPDEVYRNAGMDATYSLAAIPDFNTLIAKSQEAGVPIFALTEGQIGQTGVVLVTTLRNRDNFMQLFRDFADRISVLTGHAVAI